VHGGMGYIEETGAAQFYRDVRVTAIYEGTNGIQAMDMVGRKLKDGGKAARALIDEIRNTASTDGLHPRLNTAADQLETATDWMLDAQINDRFAGAAPYLQAFALTLGGHYLLKAALADRARMPLAAFFIRQLMPQVTPLCAAACEGANPLYADPLAL